MDNEKQEAIKRATYELTKELKLVSRIFTHVLNGLKPIEEFQKAVKGFQEKRQLLNNLNQGILVSIGRFNIVLFQLSGDPEKDGGQKNLSKNS